MIEGLQLHRALLSSVSPHLENKDKVTALQADIRDLVIQINKVGERTLVNHSVALDK